MSKLTICYYFNQKVEQLTHIEELKKLFSSEEIQFKLVEIKDFNKTEIEELLNKNIKALPCFEISNNGKTVRLLGEQSLIEYEMQIRENL